MQLCPRKKENVFYLCKDLCILIYEFNPLHRDQFKNVLNEMLKKCSKRLVSDENDNLSEKCFFEHIHSIYSDENFWKNRGWCSIKCGSLNWPHSCDLCLFCGADEIWCDCNK